MKVRVPKIYTSKNRQLLQVPLKIEFFKKIYLLFFRERERERKRNSASMVAGTEGDSNRVRVQQSDP